MKDTCVGVLCHAPMYALCLFALLAIAGYLLTERLLNRLRFYHGAVWAKMGGPAIPSRSLRSASLFLIFIWTADVSEMGDRTLAVLVWMSRIVGLMMLAVIVGCYIIY